MEMERQRGGRSMKQQGCQSAHKFCFWFFLQECNIFISRKEWELKKKNNFFFMFGKTAVIVNKYKIKGVKLETVYLTKRQADCSW